MGEEQNIYSRSYKFSRDILLWVRTIRPDFVSKPLITQMIRSSTSIGANLQEAYAASSRKDFIHKISIALREARETHYWLRLLHETDDSLNQELVGRYIQEAHELSSILGKIRITSMASKSKTF